MITGTDDTTEVERPRTRRLVAIVAVLVPVIAVIAGSAWFVRSYVFPPTVPIPEPTAVASTGTVPARRDPAPEPAPSPIAAPAPAPETTGSAPAFPIPEWRPTRSVQSATSSVWDSVPLPGPPREALSLTEEPPAAASEPVHAAVPLPRQAPRPRLSADASVRVPLPKPRPAIAAN